MSCENKIIIDINEHEFYNKYIKITEFVYYKSSKD